ncbi:hypothetical protein B0E53_03973 [Micromonospora sp. MH33]|uniref:hypothetical protein n=1 Tax=Micromonospora sp. MH33 TaxID=1945509 RepID=UPI000D14B849|nr:hypothetical protein [Micromonospora sp. MH33]PSK64068.1 hypothetical protein B0E53_03973 [Micromonospora sp. MH33]
MAHQDLNQMKTGEVAKQARKAGIDNVDQMNKDEMIQAMSRGGGSGQPGRGGGKGDSPQPSGTRPQQWKNVPGNQS